MAINIRIFRPLIYYISYSFAYSTIFMKYNSSWKDLDHYVSNSTKSIV